MKESILFVDDDLNLLQGLQRMLRSKRNDWEMVFVSSAREALDLMKLRCFDVVVTDMRMPEMDGADLLLEVKKICPCSVRIILSGQAEIESIMKAVGSAHQYLSKPCDAELLYATIERASKLRKVMGNRELEQFVSQLESIPSQPDIYELLEAELSSESPSLERIGEAASKDIGISVKVLQLTNSSFFGQKREVVSPREAVNILGIDILRRLFSGKSVFSKCESGKIGTLDIGRLHERGTSVGNFAQRIAALEGLPRVSGEMYSNTGLICRIGCIILGLFMPDEHREVLVIGEECQASVNIERKLFGTSHSEIGGYLLGLWGLPNQMVDAASRHHESSHLDKTEFPILSALQIAENLASSNQFETGGHVEHFESFSALRDRMSDVPNP